MKITSSDVCAEIEKIIERESLFAIVCENSQNKWQAIRKIYRTIDISQYTPYPVDWTKIFTPIESMAWGEIRGVGLPFYPQYPIGRFFVDFADPVKKIVIECDGKEFHSAEKDADRDSILNDLGWRVFRVSGADCFRSIPSPFDAIWNDEVRIDSDEVVGRVSEWAETTVDGLVWSLSVVHYDHSATLDLRILAAHVLACRSGGGR